MNNKINNKELNHWGAQESNNRSSTDWDGLSTGGEVWYRGEETKEEKRTPEPTERPPESEQKKELSSKENLISTGGEVWYRGEETKEEKRTPEPTKRPPESGMSRGNELTREELEQMFKDMEI